MRLYAIHFKFQVQEFILKTYLYLFRLTPANNKNTKTKQKMTHLTTEQDSKDWIFCFVKTIGWHNSTPCFVQRNTILQKQNKDHLEKLATWNDLIRWRTPMSSWKGHEMVISNLLLFIWHQKQCITFSYIVIIILFLLYGKGNFVPSWTKQISVLFLFLSWARVSLILFKMYFN